MVRRSNLFSLRRQSGTILVTVLLIVAFVAVLEVQVNKTVSYQTQLNRNLIQRDQAYSFLLGMEELAKIYLKKEFDNEKEDVVHLNQAWAGQDITFPIEGGQMVASIRDMQSCFNLNSLLVVDNQSQGNETANEPIPLGEDNKAPKETTPPTDKNLQNDESKTPVGTEILTLLISKQTQAEADPLVAAVVDWLDADFKPNGPDGVEDGYYQGLEIPYLPANSQMAHTSELLAVKDFSKKIYDAIKNDICVLPNADDYQINVNTITVDHSTLLYAALGGKVSEQDVKTLISERPEEGYDKQSFLEALAEKNSRVKKSFKERIGVTSKYFQMNSHAEINKSKVYLKTLFLREENNNFKVVSRYFGKE